MRNWRKNKKLLFILDGVKYDAKKAPRSRRQRQTEDCQHSNGLTSQSDETQSSSLSTPSSPEDEFPDFFLNLDFPEVSDDFDSDLFSMGGTLFDDFT